MTPHHSTTPRFFIQFLRGFQLFSDGELYRIRATFFDFTCFFYNVLVGAIFGLF